MKLMLKTLLLFTLINSLPLSAQQDKKIDSILNAYKNHSRDTLKVKTLNTLFNTFLYQDPEEALKYAREELQLSEELKYGPGVARSYYHLGVYFNNSDQTDSARYYYKSSLKEFERMNDVEGQAGVIHGLAILDYTKGNYDKALSSLAKNVEIYGNQLGDSSRLAMTYDLIGAIQTFKGNHNIAIKETLKALAIFNKIDKPIRKADALNHLATTEFYLGNYQKTLEYNKEALEIYKDHNDKYYQSQALNDIGNTYYYLEDYEQAIEYLEQGLKLAIEMNVPDIEATALGNLGKAFMKKGQYKNAISNINKSLGIVRSTNSTNKIAEALNQLAMVYSEMKEPALAIPYFNEAIVIADSIKAQESLRLGYYNRSIAFAALKAYDKALEDHRSFQQVSDSIYDATKSQQIEELRTIYDTEKKEQQIVLQENEIDLLEQKAEISSLQRILMGAALLLSLLGLYGVRQKMKRNKIERQKVDAELAFKKKELTTHALHLAKKNEVLEGLKQKAKELKQSEENKKGYTQLIRTIDFDLQDDNNWENFAKYFEEVHKDFNGNVKRKYPEVTSNELRLLALLKMNLTSKEIANILNISQEGIKKARYRLRKKLDITTEESLQDLVMTL